MLKAFLYYLLGIGASLVVSGSTFDAPRILLDINTVPYAVNSDARGVCGSAGFVDLAGSRDHSVLSLWRTDGTADSARLLHDFGTASAEATLECLAVAGGISYMSFAPSRAPAELWRSDGTMAGTFRLMSASVGSGAPVRLAGVIGGRPLFFSSSAATWMGLFSSDGSVAGTHLVEDLASAVQGTDVGAIATLGSRIYFSIGLRLWSTDGTSFGTGEVTTLDTSSATVGNVTTLQAIGARLIAITEPNSGGAGLWSTDGTVAGTGQLQAYGPSDGNLPLSSLRPLSDAALFVRQSPLQAGLQLWRTDGTTVGTYQLAGPNGDLTVPVGLSDTGKSRQFFVGRTAQYGSELWVTAALTPAHDCFWTRCQVRVTV